MIRVGLIDNLQNIDSLVLHEGYEAHIDRYMAGLGGNNGNLAFVHGVRKCLENKITRVGWGWTPEQVKSHADVLVVSCANQIGAHADLGGWADAVMKFDLPIVLIGLGAQTTNYEADVEVPEGSRRFLREVAKRRPGSAPNIAVRGEFTHSVLQGFDVESEAIGCPSLYISSDTALGATIAKRSAARPAERIAVAAGNPFHVANRKIEGRMIELCDRYSGAYVVQHPNSIVGMSMGQYPDEAKLAVVSKALGFADSEACLAWFERNAYSFHEPRVWMHFLRHYDAVVGARYHGVALGVQAGIPGATLHIDNRTRELSVTTGIPSIGVEEVEGMSVESIVDAARWNEAQGERFDQNRKKRAAWMARFITSCGLQPSARLSAIAEA
jgi:hypothetical protein